MHDLPQCGLRESSISVLCACFDVCRNLAVFPSCVPRPGRPCPGLSGRAKAWPVFGMWRSGGAFWRSGILRRSTFLYLSDSFGRGVPRRSVVVNFGLGQVTWRSVAFRLAVRECLAFWRSRLACRKLTIRSQGNLHYGLKVTYITVSR